MTVMAIVTVTVLVVAVLLASPAPAAVAADDFYAPPSPLPAAAPGTLIRAEPIVAPAGARICNQPQRPRLPSAGVEGTTVRSRVVIPFRPPSPLRHCGGRTEVPVGHYADAT